MQIMRDAASRLEPVRAEWAQLLHPDVRMIIGHLHLPFLAWLVKHSKYPHLSYVSKLMRGKPDLGEILPTGVFREERKEATMTMSEWTSNPKAGTLRCSHLLAAPAMPLWT